MNHGVAPLPAGLRLINIDNISSPGCLNYRSNAGHGGSRAAIVAYRTGLWGLRASYT